MNDRSAMFVLFVLCVGGKVVYEFGCWMVRRRRQFRLDRMQRMAQDELELAMHYADLGFEGASDDHFQRYLKLTQGANQMPRP